MPYTIKIKNIEVENSDVWVMLISTIRYSIGRGSYMISLAPELVLKYSDALSCEQLKQIADEIDGTLFLHEDRWKFINNDEKTHCCWRLHATKIRELSNKKKEENK